MHLKTGNWGGSTAIRLPKSAVETLGIKEGAEVEATIENGALVIRAARKRYSLAQLLKEARRATPPTPEDDEPVGEEWPKQ